MPVLKLHDIHGPREFIADVEIGRQLSRSGNATRHSRPGILLAKTPLEVYRGQRWRWGTLFAVADSTIPSGQPRSGRDAVFGQRC